MTEALVRLQNIHHRFEGDEVLRGVDFDLYPGEIHALTGERKAGKSTLSRILAGDLRKQTGKILIKGKEVTWLTPHSAMRLRIGMLHQHKTVLPTMTLVENVYSGLMPHFLISKKDTLRMEEQCLSMLARFGLNLDIWLPLNRLSESEQQIAELMRLFALDLDVLILDEVSSRRSPDQLRVVTQILQDLRSRGKGIIYITASMDEVIELADRVTILKDGLRQGTEQVKDLDRVKLLSLAYSFAINRDSDEEMPSPPLALHRFGEDLIQTLPTAAVLIDPEGTIKLANALAQQLGGEKRSLPGKTLRQFLESLGVQESHDVLAARLGKEPRTWEKLAFGQGQSLRLKLSPLWEEAMHQGAILFIEDVSIDQQMKEYLSRADQAASLPELAAGVAHEINNPLGIIQNYLILTRMTESAQERAENLGIMEKELQRITEIVQSLLSFSRVNQSPKKRTNVERLLEEVLMLMAHKFSEKRLTIITHFPEEPVIAALIENKIKQLFLNLLVNACEAVLPQGEIQVEVSRDSHAGHAEVRIRDNGNGIPPEIQDKIFTPFYTTKITKTNTGLGLSICQHIAELHGGVITFESSAGNGTQFVVRLPLK